MKIDFSSRSEVFFCLFDSCFVWCWHKCTWQFNCNGENCPNLFFFEKKNKRLTRKTCTDKEYHMKNSYFTLLTAMFCTLADWIESSIWKMTTQTLYSTAIIQMTQTLPRHEDTSYFSFCQPIQNCVACSVSCRFNFHFRFHLSLVIQTRFDRLCQAGRVNYKFVICAYTSNGSFLSSSLLIRTNIVSD